MKIKLHDEFIENTITNFYIPLGVAPNFLINGKYSTIPMAIEESSVVAAASKSAKFGPQEVVSKQPLSIPKNRSGTLHVHR
jgi:hydroxymethylglutaryl-CoA reductase